MMPPDLSKSSLSSELRPPSKKIPLQNGKGFLKADVFLYDYEGQLVICKDYGRYAGSWLAWPARLLLRREARILERLKDWPHSPKVIGCLGTLALMMEFIPGDLLSEEVIIGNAAYFTQLVCVMKSLHQKSITHNDVRGTNIIVSGGKIVLIDFASAIQVKGVGRLLQVPLKRSDMSHLLKFKGRLTGIEPTAEEQKLYGQPHWIHVIQKLWKNKLLPFFKRHLG